MNPIELALLLMFAPRFLRDMPRPRRGWYKAVVVTESPWYRAVCYEAVVRGRLRAYLNARWAAFDKDFSLPNLDGEVGVYWRIEEL